MDLGNYDQCVQINHAVGQLTIKGKYCLAAINTVVPIPNSDDESRTLSKPVHNHQVNYLL